MCSGRKEPVPVTVKYFLNVETLLLIHHIYLFFISVAVSRADCELESKCHLKIVFQGEQPLRCFYSPDKSGTLFLKKEQRKLEEQRCCEG